MDMCKALYRPISSNYHMDGKENKCMYRVAIINNACHCMGTILQVTIQLFKCLFEKKTIRYNIKV